MQWPKESTGWERSRKNTSIQSVHYPSVCNTCGASLKLDTILGSVTGSCFWCSPPSNDCPSSRLLFREAIGSSPDPLLQQSTYGKKRHASMEPSLNLEPENSNANPQPTGTLSEPWQDLGNSTISQLTFTFVVITNSEASATTLLFQFQSFAQAFCTGAKAALGKREGLSKKLEHYAILKIPEQNGGVVTEAKNMLFSMNFEVLFFNFRNN